MVLKNGVVLMFGEYMNDSLIHCTTFLSEPAAAGGAEESAEFLSFHELSELVQSMPGFLLLLTAEGKLLYLTDSVSEHLGHSMVSLNIDIFIITVSLFPIIQFIS